MKKFHMIIDLEKCVGCFNCMLACKDEHVGNRWMPYTEEQQKHEDKWVCPTMTERGIAPYTEVTYVTKLCQHCDNAPCVKKYPDAFIKRSDGLVILDPKKARGRKELVDACPYGNVHWNDDFNLAQKCTGCAHLTDQGWVEPRCVQACPLRALQSVYCEDYEWEKIVDAQGLKPITDGTNKPRVMYKNLFYYNKCFIKGALAFDDEEGREVAAVGAHVSLLINNIKIAETDADFLGEFYIDKIPKNSGKITVKAELDGYDAVSQEVEVKEESICLECMKFGSSEAGKSAVILPNEKAIEQAFTHMTKADEEESRKAWEENN